MLVEDLAHSEPEANHQANIRLGWGGGVCVSPRELRSSSPNAHPFGKVHPLGLAKAQINCLGQLRVQHLSAAEASPSILF